MPLKRCNLAISYDSLLCLIALIYLDSVKACISGSGGGVCCPASVLSCAPAIPVCSSNGYSPNYLSSSADGGSYAAPYAVYPRPIGYSAVDCMSSTTGCSSSSSSNTYAYTTNNNDNHNNNNNYPSPVSAPLDSYKNAIAPLVLTYQPNLSPQPVNAHQSDQNQLLPDSAPKAEIESTYDDIKQEHLEPQINEPSSTVDNMLPVQQIPQSHVEKVYQNTLPPPEYPLHSESVSSNQNGNSYGDETGVKNVMQPTATTSPFSYGSSSDAATTYNAIDQKTLPAEAGNVSPLSTDYGNVAIIKNNIQSELVNTADVEELNCEDNELRQIVETALLSTADNLSVARKIESDAATRFGGRFNSIVSSSEFAYVNWYGKRNCQLRVNTRHSLTWED